VATCEFDFFAANKERKKEKEKTHMHCTFWEYQSFQRLYLYGNLQIRILFGHQQKKAKKQNHA